MNAVRTERLSVNLSPEVMQQLLRFAQRNRWTLSTAAAVLIERGVTEEDDQ
jgi:macrodomain Ter protein organizer (MatP/YcbG family)